MNLKIEVPLKFCLQSLYPWNSVYSSFTLEILSTDPLPLKFCLQSLYPWNSIYSSFTLEILSTVPLPQMFKNVMWKLRKRTECACVKLGMLEMGLRVEKTPILVIFIQKYFKRLIKFLKYLYLKVSYKEHN